MCKKEEDEEMVAMKEVRAPVLVTEVPPPSHPGSLFKPPALLVVAVAIPSSCFLSPASPHSPPHTPKNPSPTMSTAIQMRASVV